MTEDVEVKFVNLHGETFISVSCLSIRKISDELTEDELSKMILDGISEKLKQRIDAGRGKYLRGESSVKPIGLLGGDHE